MLKLALIVVGVLAVAVAAFVAWRLWATYAGGARVYAELADRIGPVEQRLVAGQDPEAAELVRFAQDRATRKVLYDALEHHGKLHLFPSAYATAEAMAEADLVLWLAHPNELAAVPDEIELMARVSVPNEPPSNLKYFVFRYRTRLPHWAAKDGWLAGIAGPYPEAGVVSPGAGGTFSRFEAYDSKTPEEHVRTTHELTTAVR
jgi:hypothetical protein